MLISWASVVNYQSLGMEIILDQSRLGVRLREPIKFQICVVGVAGEKKKKRMPRCGASSPAGESSVERVLDGGGVPLMRERAKEGTDLARIGGLLHSSAGYC